MQVSETRPPRRRGELIRDALQLVALAALLATAFWIVRPFLGALLWAVMIAVSTWPLLLRAQALFGGRRGLAVALLTAVLLLVLVVPSYFGISAVVENAEDISNLTHTVANMSLPQPPGWLEGLPVVGAKVATEWRQIASESPEELAARVTPYARDIGRWLLAEVGNIGGLVLHFLLTVALTAILYANGEAAGAGVQRFARRLGGPQAEKAVRLAAQAIRAVALGVIVTALVQTGLVAIGLLAIGIPFAAVLILVSFVLAIAQIGAAPVLIGAVIWGYLHIGAVWATVFVVWSLFCTTIDNFIRPVLIKRGADLPLLLIFAGVIGGLLAFGVVGLFVGPVVLAVTYTLLGDWLAETQ
jgi:predicted PurR-regulated permease PerM